MAGKIQIAILEKLSEEPEKWFTTNEIERETEFSRSCINTAINSLVEKEEIEREFTTNSRGRKKNKFKYKEN